MENPSEHSEQDMGTDCPAASPSAALTGGNIPAKPRLKDTVAL
jgi:hypothetical protein